MNLVSHWYTVVMTYLTPEISNRVSAILRWSSCMQKWGNQQDCSFSKFKPLDTLSRRSQLHTLQKTGPSYAKQCTLGKLYLRSNLSRKRMRKTDCFGKTRIVLHVPSSSWAGKRIIKEKIGSNLQIHNQEETTGSQQRLFKVISGLAACCAQAMHADAHDVVCPSRPELQTSSLVAYLPP